MPPDTRAQLQAAVAADPDNAAALGALADFLTEAGDPRGEFMLTQLALERGDLSPAVRASLAAREGELLDRHEREWLGDAGPILLERRGAHSGYDEQQGDYAHAFRRGLLASVRVPLYTTGLAGGLNRAPMASALRELAADDIDEDALAALVRAPFLATLQKLRLGAEAGDDEETFNCFTNGEAFASLAVRAPRLEALRLLAYGVDTPALFASRALPRLRLLQVYHANDYPVEFLAGNPAMANLETLLLFPRASPGDPRLGVEGLQALGESPHLRSLRNLRCRASDAGDAGSQVLVETGLLGRLRTLDLRFGRVTDAGLDILMACPGFGGLTWLDLGNNRLSQDAVGRLAATGVPHHTGFQYHITDEDDERADEYLYAGDVE